MNQGERDEMLIKLRLIELRDSNSCITLRGNTFQVKSVSFMGQEFGKIPVGTIIGTSLSDADLNRLSQIIGCSKAGVFDKADVYINNVGYSIKSLTAAPPALVNHTARDGWERICSVLKIRIDELDAIIDDYWQKRKSHLIKEDVHNTDKNSPFYSHKEYLLPLINYFLFKGTGSRDSKSPADYILDFSDPLDESTWTAHGMEYLNDNWDSLVFSLRSSKGMGNYPDISNKAKKDSMAKWTEYFQGAYKGALHVRFKNGK